MDGAGFAAQGELVLKRHGNLDYTDSTATLVQNLLANVSQQNITVKKFQRYSTRNVTTLLSYKGNPMLFVTATKYGARQVVFAFDLHDSNLPLNPDFIPLMKNLMEYSFPPILEESSYTAGDTLAVNVVAGCTSIEVEAPSHEISYLDTSTVLSEFALSEVGTYKVTMTVAGNKKVFRVYSALSSEESVPLVETEEERSLNGQATSNGMDGKYDNLFLVFIGLGIIFLLDWAVYCYDRYQLR